MVVQVLLKQSHLSTKPTQQAPPTNESKLRSKEQFHLRRSRRRRKLEKLRKNLKKKKNKTLLHYMYTLVHKNKTTKQQKKIYLHRSTAVHSKDAKTENNLVLCYLYTMF
jgi:hypothetical protein